MSAIINRSKARISWLFVLVFFMSNCIVNQSAIELGCKPTESVKVIINPELEKWKQDEWVQCSGTLSVPKRNGENPIDIIIPAVNRSASIMGFSKGFPKLPDEIKHFHGGKAVVIGKLHTWKGFEVPDLYLLFDVAYIIMNPRANQ